MTDYVTPPQQTMNQPQAAPQPGADRQQILNYLLSKRKATAPVAVAENNVYDKRQRLQAAQGKWGIAIPVLIVLGLIVFFFGYRGQPLFYYSESGSPQLNAHFWGGLLIGIGAFLIYRKSTRYVEPARAALAEAQELLNQEVANPVYQSAAQGFPQNFYNYSDINRLYNLVAEGRAHDLISAYNLLEQQQYNETQLSIQEEMRNLQADVANSARLTAVASTITAYNTYRMNKK